MSFWTAVVIIVALAILADVIKNKHRAQHGITVVTDALGGEQVVERNDAALKREVEELRERVKVLERIATDDRGSKLLSAEIDRLRDEQP
jgi:hypothetical protein